MKDCFSMSKKQVCISCPPVAYYCGGRDIHIHSIGYGIDDYVYYSEGLSSEKPSYHRAKIYYTEDDSYFMASREKIRFSDCLRVNL